MIISVVELFSDAAGTEKETAAINPLKVPQVSMCLGAFVRNCSVEIAGDVPTIGTDSCHGRIVCLQK